MKHFRFSTVDIKNFTPEVARRVTKGFKRPHLRVFVFLRAALWMNLFQNWLRAGLALLMLLGIGLALYAARGAAQSGSLIPVSIKNEPDPSILSLPVMKVEIRVDNQHAWVKVMQIFDNHTNQVLEGKYLFALPIEGALADFAVWDGDLRLPGVIMEKRRANGLYSQIKSQIMDPGLVEQDDEHGGASAFSAKVFPIPAYGSKRVELEYTEMLPVENLSSRFNFPLKSSFGPSQKVGDFSLDVQVVNSAPISTLRFSSGAYPMKAIKEGPNEARYEFRAQDIELKDDLAFEYTIAAPASAMSFIAHRAPERVSAYDLRDPSLAASNPDGYFEAQAIFNEESKKQANAAAVAAPRNILFMLDVSLSMHGEKLARAVEAVDFFLHKLTPRDHFNLAVFSDAVTPFSQTPLSAEPQNVERAMAFLRGSMLSGGTDLNQALLQSVAMARPFPAGERSVVLISDANPTLKTASTKRIVQSFNEANSAGGASQVRLLALALGSDANRTLLEEATRQSRGYFAQARETEQITSQLHIVFSRIGRPSIEGVHLTPSDPKNITHLYAVRTGSAESLHTVDGAGVAFVGRYKQPSPSTQMNVQAKLGAESIDLSQQVTLPALEPLHDHLPRVWARARVDALLDEMNLNGENEAAISEIIRLSQKYKFVTPYTAFLAAPRSLLRPRVIQPGDPVIRVKTDPSIKSVFAVLPFGETLALKFLQREGLWETRFLAPAWMPDGSYRCRLLLTDQQGRGYQEEKTFIIDSRAPQIKASTSAQTIHTGDELLVKATADRDTRRLVARLYGAEPVELVWSDKEKANIGRLRAPRGLVSGSYPLTISAEDFAHNQSNVELQITVIDR